MKKNKMMRVASALLVAVLMTTSVISGTFAKYVTQASATDSARVAKWGITVEMMAGESIFDDMYGAGDVGVDSNPNVAGVNGSTPVDVVAPGTKGTLSTITLTGTPEVTVDVTTRIKLDLTNWTVGGGTEYCPIVFTIGTKTYGMTGIKDMTGDVVDNQCATVAALETAVINAIFTVIYGSSGWTPEAYTGTGYENEVVVQYTPNHTFEISSATFSWEWAFEGNVDASDTVLGDNAATGTAPEIDFAMQVIAEQVD